MWPKEVLSGHSWAFLLHILEISSIQGGKGSGDIPDCPRYKNAQAVVCDHIQGSIDRLEDRKARAVSHSFTGLALCYV